MQNAKTTTASTAQDTSLNRERPKHPLKGGWRARATKRRAHARHYRRRVKRIIREALSEACAAA